MTNGFLNLLFSALALVPVAANGQPASISLEDALPADCCLHATIRSPAENVQQILESLQLDQRELPDTFRQLAKTTLIDETTRDESFAIPQYLLQSRSLHFFVRDSEKSVGAFGLAIELDDKSRRPSPESLQPIVSLVSFVARKLLANRSQAGTQLDKQISMFESSHGFAQVGRWVIVTHDRSTETELINRLNRKTSAGRVLSGNRAYLAAQRLCMDDAFLTCYMLPRRAKSILSLWEREVNQSLETVAWIHYSALFKNSERIARLNQKTVFRRTEPVGGSSKYWDFYRELKNYPNAKFGNWQIMTAQNVDLDAWLERYEKNQTQLAKRPSKDQAKDAVANFLAGKGRSELGGQIVYAEMDDQSNQTWYFIGDRDQNAAAQQVTDYFVGMDKNYRQVGYDVKLDMGTAGVWSLEIADAIRPPDESSDMGAMGGSFYSKPREGVNAKSQVAISWAKKYARQLDQWLVIGTKTPVENTIESYDQMASDKKVVFAGVRLGFRFSRLAILVCCIAFSCPSIHSILLSLA